MVWSGPGPDATYMVYGEEYCCSSECMYERPYTNEGPWACACIPQTLSTQQAIKSVWKRLVIVRGVEHTKESLKNFWTTLGAGGRSGPGFCTGMGSTDGQSQFARGALMGESLATSPLLSR